MMKRINELLMALDEKGYIVERVLDEYVCIYDKNGVVFFESSIARNPDAVIEWLEWFVEVL